MTAVSNANSSIEHVKGTLAVVKKGHILNAYPSITVTLVGIVILVNPEAINADTRIYNTEEGIVMDVKAIHSLNVPVWISVRFDESVIEDNPVHPENVFCSIVVTVDGITIVVNAIHPLNVSSEIVTRPDDKLTDDN